MSRFLEALHSGRVLLMDGAMGTELVRAGLDLGRERCESWNLLHPEQVTAIHRAYEEAGAQCLVTNSFRALGTFIHHEGRRRSGSSSHDLRDEWVNETRAAVALARTAGRHAPLILGSVGPLLPTEIPEILLEHVIWGAVEEAAQWCSLQIEFLEGADAILLETQSALDVLTDLVEYACPLGPKVLLLVSFGFGAQGGRIIALQDSCLPEEVADWASNHVEHVAALGVNCGRNIGLDEILEILRRYRRVTDLPLFVRPNAGTPTRTADGWAYPLTPTKLAARLPELLKAGITMFGGCCGTTPEHIAACRPIIDDWNRRHAPRETPP